MREDGPDYEAVSRKCRACEARDIAAHDAAHEAQKAETRLNGFYWIAQEVSNGHG